jgi:hypothetical protein
MITMNRMQIILFGVGGLAMYLLIDLVGCKSLEKMADTESAMTVVQEALASCDKSWEEDKKTESVKACKALTKLKGFGDLETADRTRVYRRIIEYEVNYGDPGEGRDWMIKAWNDTWVRRNLTMDSPKGKALQEDVRTNREGVPSGGGGLHWTE